MNVGQVDVGQVDVGQVDVGQVQGCVTSIIRTNEAIQKN